MGRISGLGEEGIVMSTTAYFEYLQLMGELIEKKSDLFGFVLGEEEELTDKLELAWNKLTDRERTMMEKLTCRPTSISA